MLANTFTTDFFSVSHAVVDNQDIAQDFDPASPLGVMLDAIPDTVLILNDKRQIMFMNEAGVSALGLESWQTVQGQRLGQLMGCIHTGQTTGGGCGATKACRSCGVAKAIINSLQGTENGQECHINLADGAVLDMRVWAKPLIIGNRAYSIFTIKDIKSETQREALDGIFFHDILNVAGVVYGFAKLLEVDSGDSPVLATNLSHAAQRLIDEITIQKAMLAAENGRLQPELADIHVSPFLREIGEEYEHHLGKPIQVIEPKVPVSFQSDPTLLGRVIGNMVKNAAEASKSGNIVTLSYTTTEDEIIFAVHNQTCIPHNAQTRIFKRGFSTKNEGRGLGTYSIKLLTEEYMGGRVWFTSTPKAGTTFYAAYPLH